MMEGTSGLPQLLLSVLFFPAFFQADLLRWAWGAQDPAWFLALKRLLLVLPSGAVILALWASIACLLTVVIRQRRREFTVALLVAWWDLGRGILLFWSGILRFLLQLAMSVIGVVRAALSALWMVVQDILLIPFRLVRVVAGNLTQPGLPWVAVVLTLVWCLIEATVFTYVMSPLVLDTLSNLTGEALAESVVRVPLFLFLLFLVLGSYAVLVNWAEAVKTRNIPSIVRLTVVEIVAVLVEVLFLYREFVDSLVPWFAQHSKDFDLGAGGTLLIAALAWAGVRGMTWFLFAGHGTPILLGLIQGVGLQPSAGGATLKKPDAFAYTVSFYMHFKADLDWVRYQGSVLVDAFLLPPLQLLAAALNFLTLLITAHPLFDLPFQSIHDLVDSKTLLQNAAPRKARKASPKADPS